MRYAKFLTRWEHTKGSGKMPVILLVDVLFIQFDTQQQSPHILLYSDCVRLFPLYTRIPLRPQIFTANKSSYLRLLSRYHSLISKRLYLLSNRC